MLSSVESFLRRPLVWSVLALALLSAACSSGSPSPTPVVLELRALLASTDLAQGENRFVFALLGPSSAPVRSSGARVTLSHVQDGAPIPQGEVQAVFRHWPVGPGGVFTARADFPQPGTWLAEITPEDGDAAGELARLSFQVQERSLTPSLGAPAPRSVNRTLADGAALEELTTDPDPDPDLYQMTIARALDSGLPLLVTFVTPAFCTTATCGPQLDVVKALKETYRGRINVIHIEIFDNPQEMREDMRKARLSLVVEEWALPSDPWTFLVDAQGRVVGKFEAFTSREELEEAVEGVLGS